MTLFWSLFVDFEHISDLFSVAFNFADLEHVCICRDEKLSTREVIMYQLWIIKPAFSEHAYTQCPDKLNATDRTNGDLNVTMYQCHQSSP